MDSTDHLWESYCNRGNRDPLSLGASITKLQTLMAAAVKPFLSLQNYGLFGHGAVVAMEV